MDRSAYCGGLGFIFYFFKNFKIIDNLKNQQQNNEESIYRRMQAERIRQANKFRSEGEEESQKIKEMESKGEYDKIMAEMTSKLETCPQNLKLGLPNLKTGLQT